MELKIENITFIIVTFNSEKIIHNCLKTLPKESSKIIIENSKNINLKNELEYNYDNIEVILSENKGMGASNNKGLNNCKTQFAFIINPDVKFKENTLIELINCSKSIDDFAILSPINSDKKFPNFKIKKNNRNTSNENIISVDYVDGFSMLINREKFKDKTYFDENFFLYLENTDLCLRAKQNNENIYIIKSSVIEHLGASSSDNNYSQDMEYLRNWHWMWSKFYFNKKHYGFFMAFLKISLNLFSAIIKFLINLITFNNHKKKIYQMRILGIFNSILDKKSWYRLND